MYIYIVYVYCICICFNTEMFQNSSQCSPHLSFRTGFSNGIPRTIIIPKTYCGWKKSCTTLDG